jgi:uncharacterized protein YjbI with pentapeptide repeats
MVSNFMIFKRVAPLLSLVLLAIGLPAPAQPVAGDLAVLCSKFPYNSRCKGIKISPPLSQVTAGDDVEGCRLLLPVNVDDKCKVVLGDRDLTLYIEQGSPVSEFGNQRLTTEIKIPADRLFAAADYLHQRPGFAGTDIYYITAIGFQPSSPLASGNRSNFVEITGGRGFSLKLRDWLTTRLKPIDQATFQGSPALAGEPIAQLRASKVCVRCDLKGADLSGLDLKGANLEGANLQGAKLSGTTLKDAYLVGANLTEATMAKANLIGVRMVSAIADRITFEDGTLESAYLQDSRFDGAKMKGARLQMISQRRTILNRSSFVGADLRGTTFEGADLRGANLAEANLEGADLSRQPVNVSTGSLLFGSSGDAQLFATQLTGASFKGANLKKAFLRYAMMEGADLSGADLTEADLHKSFMVNANLTGANLTGARATDINMKGINLKGAIVTQTNLDGSVLCGGTMPDGTAAKQGCP